MLNSHFLLGIAMVLVLASFAAWVLSGDTVDDG